jgi:hypothetical protein
VGIKFGLGVRASVDEYSKARANGRGMRGDERSIRHTQQPQSFCNIATMVFIERTAVLSRP